MVGRYQPLADGSGCLCCPLPDQTCLLQSLQKTKRSDRSMLPTGGSALASGTFTPKPVAGKNASSTKHKKAGGGKPPAFAQRAETYLISAFAPASSSFFLASSAAAFGTASLTGFGAPSTRSFASFRPETRQFTNCLDDGNLVRRQRQVRLTVNSVCSSTAAAACAACRACHCNSSGRHAKLLFERLDQFVQFQNRHRAYWLRGCHLLRLPFEILLN